MEARDTNTGKTIKNRNVVRRFGSALAKGGKKALRIIVGKTLPQRLFRLYLIVIVTGALLLCAPFCLNKIEINGQLVQLNGFANVNGYNFVQALFIACSGFSDTGLTPVNIYEYLNPGGQVVLLILIEVGGIGVVALFYYVWNFFKKKDDKIDVGQLYILQAERGGSRLSQSFHVIKVALIFILSAQVVFMFGFALCFCFIPAYEQTFLENLDPTITQHAVFQGISFNTDKMLPMYHNFGYSLWIGLFTTVSAMNNAGFDNISATSMAPFRNDLGIIFQTLIVLELIIGGLGHFVWFDVIEKIKCKAIGRRYKMSLYSKVAISVYAIVAVFGLAGAFIAEFTNPQINSTLVVDSIHGRPILMKDLCIIGNQNQFGEFGKNPMLNKCFAIIFQTFNCRSLGMETIKTNVFCEGTKWILVILMFIGASPCSTAGGIRTTTLAVILVTIWCKLCGRKNVFFFKRRINPDTVTQAFMIFVISLVLLLVGAVVVWSATPVPPEYAATPSVWFTFSEFMVECASAFGTVGLSAGITGVTEWWGLLYLILLMFVGQLGVINTLLSWTRFHPHFNDIEYPYEDIKIG
ncbi:MAG: TrkH family potassium uptake protein [Mycoplasma sp.]|nr:TrkH family potassium uptake protein [Candidatus Hennigella equi]